MCTCVIQLSKFLDDNANNTMGYKEDEGAMQEAVEADERGYAAPMAKLTS